MMDTDPDQRQFVFDNDKSLTKLREIMRRLRDPETGCPWDRRQTFQTIVPRTFEGACEAADTVERQTTAKFEQRIRNVERALEAAGKDALELTPEKLDQYWTAAKAKDGSKA